MEENEYKEQRGMWGHVEKTPFKHKEECWHKGGLHGQLYIILQFHLEAKSCVTSMSSQNISQMIS